MKRTVHTSLGIVALRVRSGSGPAGPPWVFLHGGSGSWRTFRTLSLSRALPEDTDQVFVDLPGWGDSPGRTRFTVEQQSSAVVEALSALGYQSWYLFGHSMGAVLALDIAASVPERTRAVVALSPAALTARAALNRPLAHLRMAPLLGMVVLMLVLRTLGPAAGRVLRFSLRTGLLRCALSPFFARPSLVPNQVFADLAADARPASFIAAAHALRKYDTDRWRSITVPAVLARGSMDIFTPPAELRSLAPLLPHADHVVLADTGHFAHIEDTAGTAALILRFRAASQTLDRLH